MTEPADGRDIRVLLLGPLHPGVRDGLAGRFDLIEAVMGAAGDLPTEKLDKVCALACAGSAPRALLDRLPKLELIASFGVGYDGIDLAYAARRGIVVTNTPDVLNDEVADATVWLLLDAMRGFSKAQSWLRAGRWPAEGPYPLSPRSLKGRSVGIWGLGRIGRAIARRLEGFGLPISYCNRRPLENIAYRHEPNLLALARAVDILIAAVPGGAATDGAVSEEVLRALGPDGIFVNVGRGSTVDEEALIRFLKNGTIAAAGLDVFAGEPRIRAEFLTLDNATVLPHIAAASVDARAAVARLVADNVIEWFAHGKPLTPVGAFTGRVG